MKKLLLALIVGAILVPQASFAAVTSVNDTQYQALINQLIVLLTKQVQILQAQLADLQAETGKSAIISSMDDDKRQALEKEMEEIMQTWQWCGKGNNKPCKEKVDRVNEILKELESTCSYVIYKDKIKRECA